MVIIAQQRDRHQGRIGPEGFRKAQRAMNLAAKCGLALINLIDTPGAYPGTEAEERGIGNAIASTIALLFNLKTPVISAIIGQGGSEGALSLGIADRVLMMENAFLSVIAPERAASIFYQDTDKAEEITPLLRLTAADCKQLGVIDLVVPEPEGGAHADTEEAARLLKNLIIRELLQVQSRPINKLLRSRYRRFRYAGRHAPFIGGVFSKETAQIQSMVHSGVLGIRHRIAAQREETEENRSNESS